MHVVILEDERGYREDVERVVLRWAQETGQDAKTTAFSSSEDLLERWQRGMDIDLLLLDIEIPGEMSGMALAQLIRARDESAAIVFITNYEHYVYEGYTVSALRYLRKPVQEHALRECLDIAARQTAMLADRRIVLASRESQVVLLHREIACIEARGHYLLFHMAGAGSGETPMLRGKLSDIARRMPAELFVRCHRSYIVSLLHIRRFTKSSVTLLGGDMIPVSQTYFAALSTAFQAYYGGGGR